MAHIDDQSLTVVNRIKVPPPLGNIGSYHRAQMDVTDLPMAHVFDGDATGVLPARISQVRVLFETDRSDHDLTRLIGPCGAYFDDDLLSRLISKKYFRMSHGQGGAAIDRRNHVA